MAYEAPTPTQVDFAFGPAGYLSASPGELDFTYAAAGPSGTVAGVGASISSTSFGTPVAAGGAAAPSPTTCYASGFLAGAFGTPSAVGPFEVSGIAPGTLFGAPLATTFMPAVIHRTGAAGAVHSTAFGTPTAGAAVSGQASAAAPSVAFGTALAGVTQHAQPVAPTAAFGAPAAGATAHADGFRSPSFGTPAAGRVQSAGSFYRETLWGVPSAAGYSAHSAEPAAIGAQFGAHIASCAYRALHLAPTARFGKPLLLRSTTC